MVFSNIISKENNAIMSTFEDYSTIAHVLNKYGDKDYRHDVGVLAAVCRDLLLCVHCEFIYMDHIAERCPYSPLKFESAPSHKQKFLEHVKLTPGVPSEKLSGNRILP